MIQQNPLSSSAETTPQYNYAIGYLRAFIVMLVVAHHSALAYLPIAPPPGATLLTAPRLWPIFPVVDTHHWALTFLLVAFNDNFFMSLMFFLSGLFFWNGFVRKGVITFLRDRFLRLGIPFIVAVGLFSPVAYYPSYLQTTAHLGFAEFWRQWRTLGMWPGGPAWFLWLLLAFDSAAAWLFTSRPTWAPSLGRLTQRVSHQPLLAGLAVVAISAASYIPLVLVFSAGAWVTLGPFAFQASRLLHYLVYFLLGVAVGVAGIDCGVLAPGGRLAAIWPFASIAAVAMFALSTTFGLFAAKHGGSALPASGFVLSCAASCFAFLALFLRFMQARHPLWESLAANSYGIYLVHYMWVSWLQYALLPAAHPGVAKCLFVFVTALLLSWMTSFTLRRIPAVARIV